MIARGNRRLAGEREPPMPQPSKILVAAPFHQLESSLASRVRRLGGGDPLARRRVVVISNRLRDRVQRLLARAGGFAGVSVLVALDLAREMAGPALALEGLEKIPPAFAEALAQKALEDARPELKHFHEGGRGCGRSLCAALTDLAEANLSPGDLRKLARRMSAPDKAQCEDLARLAEDFRRALREMKRCDGSSLLEMACERAEAAPPRVPTIFYGFAEMNALQRRLVKAACREAETHALVPARADAPACAHAQPLIRWFEELGFARGEAEAAEARPLAPLADALFADSGGAAARVPGDALRIVTAPGPGREAREACREMLKAREAAPGAGEICVLTTSGSGYQSLLRETLEALEIPCRVEEGTPLSAAPAGRLFLLMLQIIAEDYPRAGMMRFLDEGGFVRADAFAALAERYGWSALAGDPALASKWEFFSRSLPYAPGAEAWLSALDAALEAMREDDEERPAAHSLALAMSDFFALVEKIPKRAPPSSFVRLTTEAFSALTSGPEGREALEEALARLPELDGIFGRVSLEEFRGLCERLLETGGLREGGEELLASLSSIQGARGLSFDVVALVGAAEGLFPPRGEENPLLPDALREEVNRAARKVLPDGGAELPLKKSREREARFQLWTILQSVRRRLILTAPEAEGEAGRESGSFPSAFLDALAKAHGEEGDSNLFTRLPGFRAAPAVLSREDMAERPVHALEWDLARILEQIEEESPEAGALSWLDASPGFARRRGALNERWRRGALTAHDGAFSDPALRELVRKKALPPARPIGVTRVETFFGCPYRFVNERLYPRMEKRPEPEPPFAADGPLWGRLTHGALEAFHRRLLPDADRPLDLEDEAGLRAALRRAVQEAMREAWKDAEAPPLPALPWGILEDALLLRLWRYVEEKREDGSAWRPVRLEEWFGGGGSAPLRIPLEEGELLLSGRIDLLERHEDGEYRVVDFKTGKAPAAKTRLGGGARLQSHLYARREAGILPEGTKVSGAYVYFTEEDGIEYRARAGAEIREDVANVDALLDYFLSTVEAGRFFPTPSDACRYCDYRTLCGPDRDARAQRKEDAPGRIALQALRERAV